MYKAGNLSFRQTTVLLSLSPVVYLGSRLFLFVSLLCPLREHFHLPSFTCFLLLLSLEMTSRCPPSEILCLYSLHLGLGFLLFVTFQKHLHNNLWHHDGWTGQLLLLDPLRVVPKSSIVWCPVRGSGYQHHSNPI